MIVYCKFLVILFSKLAIFKVCTNPTGRSWTELSGPHLFPGECLSSIRVSTTRIKVKMLVVTNWTNVGNEISKIVCQSIRIIFDYRDSQNPMLVYTVMQLYIYSYCTLHQYDVFIFFSDPCFYFFSDP
jgi:hypothetical protein